MEYIGYVYHDKEYFEHHGILGMKWGVRRFQNPDGSLTPAGEARYNRKQKREEAKTARAEAKRAKEAAKPPTKAEIRAQQLEKLSKMSDQEIRDAIARKQLENQYKQLVLGPDEVSAGKKYMNTLKDKAINALIDAGVNVGKAYVEKALKDRLGLNDKGTDLNTEIQKENLKSRKLANESAELKLKQEKAKVKADKKEDRAEKKEEKKSESYDKEKKELDLNKNKLQLEKDKASYQQDLKEWNSSKNNAQKAETPKSSLPEKPKAETPKSSSREKDIVTSDSLKDFMSDAFDRPITHARPQDNTSKSFTNNFNNKPIKDLDDYTQSLLDKNKK